MGSIANRIPEGHPSQAHPAQRGRCGTVLRLFGDRRYCPWLILATAGAIYFGVWVAGPLSGSTADSELAGSTATARNRAEAAGAHYVGPQQLAASNTSVRRDFRGFAAEADDGLRLGWNDLSAGRPVVLVFIKSGCPCNVEVEAHFARVERLYRDVAQFAGVIDGDVAAARDYASQQSTGHPVLADPGLEIIRRFEARNGCYFALLTPEGVLDRFWPGCSADSMSALGRRIAALARIEERVLDVSGMPAALVTGCPLGEGNGL